MQLETEARWAAEQSRLKAQLIERDELPEKIRYIGGVDLSFVKNTDDACAALVVLDADSLKVVYSAFRMVKLTLPYIPGFLAFREVEPLVALVQELRERGGPVPDLIVVDGNGILHPRGFGLASHLGVLTGIPTIGAGKKLFEIDGLTRGSVKAQTTRDLQKKGDISLLTGKSGKVWGIALRSSEEAVNPMFISVGHRVSLDRAIQIIRAITHYKVPEPTRQADMLSREFLRHLQDRS